MSKRFIFTVTAFVLCMVLFAGTGQRANAGGLYDQLKGDYSDYIDTLKDHGVTEGQIESFVNDVEADLAGVELTEDNFNDKVLGSLLNVAGKHTEVLEAMVAGFDIDLKKALDGNVPEALRPIYNTVKAQLLEESPGGGSGGGSGGGAGPEPEQPEAPTPQEPAQPEVVVPPADEQIRVNLPQFTDVDKHWAQKEIAFMVEAGVVNGVSEEEFQPNAGITRAQFAAMLLRLLDVEENPTAAEGFDDVDPRSWYRGVVGAAVQKGLIAGYDSRRFGPDGPVNREQMATILYRVMIMKNTLNATGLDQDIALAGFGDRDGISPWAREGVAGMVGHGLMAGRGTDKFVPRGESTRAEAVVLLYRLQAEF
ncbi:MAG: S-layer homology domain-containing protein [Firmicutes bacterium]|nr:S-layer homology domain-containing protein [Bacillota bacterium]